jgi:DNA-binding GntR family transcriptional regulator
MRLGLNIIQKLSGVSPIDMMAVRRIIEPRAAALAATNASAGALKEIAAVHSASVAAREMEAFERCDTELHQKIFAATRNDLSSAPASAAAVSMTAPVRAAAGPRLAVVVQAAAAPEVQCIAARRELLRLARACMAASAWAPERPPAAAEALRSWAARSARKLWQRRGTFVPGWP